MKQSNHPIEPVQNATDGPLKERRKKESRSLLKPQQTFEPAATHQQPLSSR
jgi:hypothetical protein